MRGCLSFSCRHRSPLQVESLAAGAGLWHVLVAWSCPPLCKSMDCSLTNSSVHGILQARTLEWVAIPFSRRSSKLRNLAGVLLSCRQILYQLNYPAMPETWVRSLGWEDPLEKGTATHSSILVWRVP